MATEALVLVIAGALIHALWNFYAKKASGGLPFVWLFGLVSLAAAAPLGFGAWLHNSHQLNGRAWAAIAASGIVHVFYSLVLQKGYQESDFSVVYPLARGTGPLFAVAGAIIFLRESPSALGWSGIIAVLAGIFLVSGLVRMMSTSPQALPGLLWGSLTGVCIAFYTVIDGWAVKTLGVFPLLYYVLGLAVRTVILAPKALANRESLRMQWRLNKANIMAVGLLSPFAYTLVLFAMTKAPLSYVAPVRELSMLVGVLIGAKLLREGLVPSRIIGTVLMVAGVVLLASAR